MLRLPQSGGILVPFRWDETQHATSLQLGDYATRQVAVSLATRQVAYFSSPHFRRIIIHTLKTKFVYGRELF